MDNLATPDDVCIRLGVDTPAEDSREYKRLDALLSDASAAVRTAIGRDVFDPVPHELKRWTCILAASALNGPGLVAGASQQTVTLDDFTEGWANYSGDTPPGLSLPPDVAARLRATYGNYVPVVEHRPGRFG